MISGADFLDALERHGIRNLTGVPCSYFGAPLRLLEAHPALRYVPAVNEGSALAMAAGARLAGTASAVIVQNSGFGNLVNPLTSLVLPYRIPLLVFMSMRGWPVAGAGEQQHRLMGRVVPGWLDSLDVPHWPLVPGGRPLSDVMADAAEALAGGDTAFVLVGKGAIEPASAGTLDRAGVTRDDLVRALSAELRDELVLSTTGFLSRAMFAAGDRPENFYTQGSMGHVASIALGAATQRPDRRFVVLDGDGSVLMHLGSLATIGASERANLVHVVFDNGAYESTGAQPTASRMDFAEMARAAGYRNTAAVSSVAELPAAIRSALDATGPSLLAVTGVVGGPAGGRASESLDVTEIAARFERGLADGNGSRERESHAIGQPSAHVAEEVGAQVGH